MLWSQIVDRASVPFEPSDEIKVKAKKYGEEAQQEVLSVRTLHHRS